MPTMARRRVAPAKTPSMTMLKRRLSSEVGSNCLSVRNWVGIPGSNARFLLHGRDQTRRIAAGAKNNRKLTSITWPLEIIDVNRGRRRRIEAVITHITGNTDDVEQMQVAVHATKLQLFSNWILVRPIPPDQLLA